MKTLVAILETCPLAGSQETIPDCFFNFIPSHFFPVSSSSSSHLNTRTPLSQSSDVLCSYQVTSFTPLALDTVQRLRNPDPSLSWAPGLDTPSSSESDHLQKGTSIFYISPNLLIPISVNNNSIPSSCSGQNHIAIFGLFYSLTTLNYTIKKPNYLTFKIYPESNHFSLLPSWSKPHCSVLSKQREWPAEPSGHATPTQTLQFLTDGGLYPLVPVTSLTSPLSLLQPQVAPSPLNRPRLPQARDFCAG